MLEHLRSMAVLAEVVDKGSFRGAAASLGLSPSVISHHVSQLERQLLELDVKEELAANRLREVLPEWKTPSPGVYALWPANATRTALSRRFVDFLAENALPRRTLEVN